MLNALFRHARLRLPAETIREFRGICLNNMPNAIEDYYKTNIEPYPCIRSRIVNDTFNAILREEMPEPGVIPWFAHTQAAILDHDELLFTYNILMTRREYQRAAMILNAFPPVAAAAAERLPYGHLA
jgi:hypothetical protein